MKKLITDFKAFVQRNKNAVAIIVLAICLFISLLCLGRSIYNTNEMKKRDIANVTALTDSINYYKSKNGDLVAEKTLLIGDMDLLRIANKDLADQIEDMKIHKPTQVVYVETIIDNSTHDTVWQAPNIDTTIVREFNFDNKWRQLNGNIKYENTDLSLLINNNKVFVNYALAIKDNKVYISSDNPYVQYNEIQGLTLPKERKPFSIGVGPTISYGYDFQHKTFGPTVGISVGVYYNIFQF